MFQDLKTILPINDDSNIDCGDLFGLLFLTKTTNFTVSQEVESGGKSYFIEVVTEVGMGLLNWMNIHETFLYEVQVYNNNFRFVLFSKLIR